LPPLLLALVALSQIALARRAELSPWLGGGFGMFSTTDHGAARFVRAVALGPGRSEPIPLAPDLERQKLLARDLPTARNAGTLARAVLAREPSATAVRVEIWRLRFDPRTLEPRAERLREAEAHRER
jgi:hypothetical protein